MEVHSHQKSPEADEELAAKVARPDEIVPHLTKSNQDAFECLNALCEKYEKQRSILTSTRSNVYKRVFKQVGLYVATIKKSLHVVKKGVSIFKDAASFLEAEGKNTNDVVQVVLAHANITLGDARDIATRLGDIRKQVYEEMPKVCCNVGMSVTDLRTKEGKDLLGLTNVFIDHFLHAITNFVNWWRSSGRDVGRLTMAIEFMLNPYIASIRDQWINMEIQYQKYATEISAQQEYYDTALSDLMPQTLVKSWTVQITTVVTATWTIKDLSRRLPDASHLSAMTDSLKDGLSRALKSSLMSPSSPSYLLTLEQRIRFHGHEMVVAYEHMSKQLQASAMLCDFLSSRVASQNKVDKTGLPTLISDANDFRLCLTHLSSSLQLTAKNLNECIGVDGAPVDGLSQEFRHAKNKVILSSSVPCKDFAGSGNVSQALQDTLEALYELSRFWEGHTLFLQAVVASVRALKDRGSPSYIFSYLVRGTRCSHEQLMKYTDPEQWKDAQRSCLSAVASVQELLGAPHRSSTSSEPGNIPSDESIPPLESVPKEETGPSLDELVAEEHPSPENLRPRVNVNAKTVHIAFYAGDTFNGPMYAANVAGRANVTCAKN